MQITELNLFKNEILHNNCFTQLIKTPPTHKTHTSSKASARRMRIESRSAQLQVESQMTCDVEKKKDWKKLQLIVGKKIQKAIYKERYADLAPLYDELLELLIQEAKEIHSQSGYPFPVDSQILFLESHIAPQKAFYLILSGQPDKAIETCTPIIQKIYDIDFDLDLCTLQILQISELLQIRAAAYLISDARELALKDLKDSNHAMDKPYGGHSILGDDSTLAKNCSFKNLCNTLFLQMIEQKLGASFVEITLVSPDEFKQMTDWEKADYFLMNHLPLEALAFVGDDKKRKAIALAQLGRFDEAMEIFDSPPLDYLDFPDIAILIEFMRGDLQKAEEIAEDDYGHFSLLAMIFFLQSSHF